MIVIAGAARVKPDRLNNLFDIVSDMAAKSRAEAGCEEYRFAVDIDDPNTVRLLAGSASPGFRTPAQEFGADFVLDLPGVSRSDL